jgi:hypothetical protein
MRAMKSQQTFTPRNQPETDHFPRFYLIPETRYVPRRRASNAPMYHQPRPASASSTTDLPKASSFCEYINREQAKFLEAWQNTWIAAKVFSRSITRWMVRWVFIPLSVACVFRIPSIHPMDLPILTIGVRAIPWVRVFPWSS